MDVFHHKYTLHLNIKFVINLDGKVCRTTWKDLIAPHLNPLKTKKKLYFITLKYTPYYNLFPKLWILVQVDSKLDIKEQIVTRIIIHGVKCTF